MSEWPGFRATLLRRFPETRGLRTYRIVQERRPISTSEPTVPSLPGDLGAILEQQLHHGMLPIDTGIAVAARDKRRHIHCTNDFPDLRGTVLRVVLQCGCLHP